MENLNIIEKPTVKKSMDGKTLNLHRTYVNTVGHLVVNRAEATLLYLELHKFLFETDNK